MKKPKTKKRQPPEALWGDQAGGYKAPASAILDAAFLNFEGEPDKALSIHTNLALLLSSLKGIHELYKRASVTVDSGRRDVATDYLLRLVVHGTLLLNKLVKEPNPVLRELAHDSPAWPSLWSPRPAFVEHLYKDLENLGVGINHQLAIHPDAKWALAGPAREWSYRIVCFGWWHRHFARTQPESVNSHPLAKVASELPPFSKGTAKQWMNTIGWPLILEATHGQPEMDPALRLLGLNRAAGAKEPGSKTERSRIRDGIKKSVLQSLIGFASSDFPLKSASK